MKSEKNFMVVVILLLFLGWAGAHKFYVGKIGMGVLYLLTGGLLGIGVIVDLIMLVCKKYTDKDGKIVDPYKDVSININKN